MNSPKTWRIVDLIEWTTDFFAQKKIETPRLDAEILLGHVLEKSRLQLYLDFDMPIFSEQLSAFRKLIRLRTEHTPISYLTQKREFMSIDFYVDRRVLIPRSETEILVEIILDREDRDYCWLIDIGTGSGAIAISLAVNRPNWEIFATDISENALDVARKNAENHNCEDRITFLCGDLFSPIQNENFEKFDWIVSNPPYVATNADLPSDVRDHEPHTALFAGSDGLAIIRRLIDSASSHLRSDGKLIFEIGYDQSKQIGNYIETSVKNLKNYELIKDLRGIDRFVLIEFEITSDL